MQNLLRLAVLCLWAPALARAQTFEAAYPGAGVDTRTLSVFGYPIGVRSLLDAFLVVAPLLTVARQQCAERARRAELELELKSAQEIQRLLVPESLSEIAGFSVQALYRPAQEVGGDFFPLLPTAHDGLLLILGDVSGKGLKAAMTVSLIIGAIRTLVEISDSPAVLLAGLNRRLVGRIGGGFATCLALRIERNGEATLANAGHLSPFLGGRELTSEGALPLGLLEDIAYPEATFVLPCREQLTFYTDGLLEARAPGGKLFGFDHIAALLATQPAPGGHGAGLALPAGR